MRPETRFWAACSYIPATETGQRKQKALLEKCAGSVQPETLWKGICRHHTFAIAEQVLRTHSMTALLAEFQPALALCAKKSRLQSNRLFFESQQLSSALKHCGIDHRFVKGPLLSEKIYGDAGLRHCKDLDLLIRPEDIGRATTFLESHCWKPRVHKGLWDRSASYRWLALRTLRHFQFVDRERRTTLEVHWRLEQAHTPHLESIWWENWDAPGPGVSDAEVLYLCLHGATHGWVRLKWIGDLQSLIERQPQLWARTLGLSQELGLESVVAQTIWLLQALFDAEPDETARGILERHPQAWKLAEFALTGMQIEDTTPGAAMPYWSYRWKLNNRLPLATRLFDLTATFALAEHLEGWNSPTVLLPVIPLMRAGSLVRRYCSNW